MADGPEAAGESTLAIVLDQVRRFGAAQIDAAAIDHAARIPPEVLAAAGRLGLFGLTIPEAYDGLGLPLGEACRVVAELARWDRSVATSVGLHLGLGTRGLVEFGTDALRSRWLPRLASGEAIAAFGATEPSAGSDLTAVRTTATLKGDSLSIDGEKSYVTNGGFASLFTLLVRSPGLGGARGHSLVCVPRDTAGLEIGPEEHKLGIRGSSTVTVRFDGVRVPLDHVLGEPGRGMEHAHRVLEWGRTLMSAGCIGTARAALDATVRHVSERRQFGRTLGKFAATQAHLAAMASRLYAMESTVEYVGRLEAASRPIGTVSAVAKVFSSEGAFDLCDRAIQLHGALGFIEDTGVARLSRDCRVTRIFEGANDVLLVRTGTALVGAEATNGERHVHGDTPAALGDALVEWQAVDARLAAAVRSTRERQGVTIIRHQHLLQRLARAHVALLAASAALHRGAAAGDERSLLLARHAAHRLSAAAAQHVDAVGRADEDAARDRALAEDLLGSADPERLGPSGRRIARPTPSHPLTTTTTTTTTTSRR